MYDFVDFTWNPIKGKCMHDCVYCYMKKWGHLKPPRLVEKEFYEFTADMEKYGEGQPIFVGSSCDIFAEDIPSEWIEKVLKFCKLYNNTYLFQSKNPARFFDFDNQFPEDTMFGTTIESNRDYPEISKAPKIIDRVDAMISLACEDFKTMVTIEPVLDFDIDIMADVLDGINPEWVNLGADSGGHKLPEPSKEKILEFISDIKINLNIEIRQKKNLKRLLN